MTSAAVEAYLSRLERELQRRGIQNRRIVDEAREHLFDALEDGLERGLSVDPVLTRDVSADISAVSVAITKIEP